LDLLKVVGVATLVRMVLSSKSFVRALDLFYGRRPGYI